MTVCMMASPETWACWIKPTISEAVILPSAVMACRRASMLAASEFTTPPMASTIPRRSLTSSISSRFDAHAEALENRKVPAVAPLSRMSS
ncbi:Uncharacterised protein [Mycobacteroides abscessus subsp. abscessus]|nr:Uncharacterised protein [Mycobacteroides abscessus subsp. abscessus]